jgi:hypothetical protein
MAVIEHGQCWVAIRGGVAVSVIMMNTPHAAEFEEHRAADAPRKRNAASSVVKSAARRAKCPYGAASSRIIGLLLTLKIR